MFFIGPVNDKERRVLGLVNLTSRCVASNIEVLEIGVVSIKKQNKNKLCNWMLPAHNQHKVKIRDVTHDITLS